jgi:hypothetical protein
MGGSCCDRADIQTRQSRCSLPHFGRACAVLRCTQQKWCAVPSGVALRPLLCTQAFVCAVVLQATFVSPQPLLALCTQRVLCSVVFCVAALLSLGDLCSTCIGAYCIQACVCHSTLQKDACRMLCLLNAISALSFVCACFARMRYCDQSGCCGLSWRHACPMGPLL